MRLLIHETAYRRLEAELTALTAGGAALQPLIVRNDGVISQGAETVTIDEAQPDIVWANADAFFSPVVGGFMTATLKSQALKWVQSGAAGYDQPVFAKIVQKGAVLSTSHGQAVGMADYVLWGVLDALQRGPERRAAQAAGEWARLPFREMDGTRWTIVGFGAIGQAVARRARAFGAHVTGVRRTAGAHGAADAMATMDQLPSLLPDTDVLVLCAPLSAENRHMADAALFGAMKPASILVNVGRGELVDEPALLAALDKGVPAHAVLDVFEVEPLPADSRFWSHPRVTLTGHASGVTAGQNARNDKLFLENLRRWLAGEPVTNVADPKDVVGANAG